MFCCSKSLFYRPKLLVAEHGLEWIEIGIGAQHEDAVELLLLLDLVGVERKVLLADRLSRVGARVQPRSKPDRRRPWRPPDGCGRRCTAAPPASPPWPRNRSPYRASLSPAARTVPDHPAPTPAPAF